VSDSKIVYRATRFHVEQRIVPGADGREHPHDILVHPGAAVVLPLLEDGRVVMIENHREAVRMELLELPAGTLDDGEAPIECARRELSEETGYTAGRMEPLTDFYTSPGILTEHMHAFVATQLTDGKTAHEPTERIRVTPMTWEDAMRAVGAGRVKDGKTLSTLLFFDRFGRGKGPRP
jgi:ADP-ribose pyrophosphatase